MIREKSNQDQMVVPVLPFFAMSHYHQHSEQYFYSLNPTQLQNNSVGTYYSIISKSLSPHSTRADFMSAQLLCCNKDLPYEALSQAKNVLNLNDSHLARRALILKRPTKSYHFEQNKKEQWRIISHLSLNTLSLMKGDAISHIKELLALYNLPKSKENQQIIDAIKKIDFSLTQKLVEAQPFPLFVRGIKVNLLIDSQIFKGHSLYIFTQLLSHIFNLKVQMNSYVDLVICDSNTQQELYQCVQNVGGKKLL
jgi:type VI secretion system protein ImpG